MMDKSPTVRANMGDNQMAVCFAVKTKQVDMRTSEETAHPLDSNDDKEPQAVCYAIDHVVLGGGNCTAQGPCWYMNISPTEKAAGAHAVCYERRDGEH